MNKKLNGETIFNLFILAYILYIMIACFTYKAYTRYIPLIVAIVSLVMIIYILIKSLKAGADTSKKLTGYFEVFLWVMLCPALIYFIGFIVGGPIYCFLFAKIRSKQKWLSSIISAFIILVILFLVYNLLSVNLHKGLFFKIIG